MELEIIAKKPNVLLSRTEVEFKAVHKKEPTPRREELRQKLSSLLNAPKENIVVDYSEPLFGACESFGYAKVYSSVADAKRLESKHILARNKLIELKKAAAEKKPAAAPAPAQQPASPEKKEKPAEKDAAEKKPEADKKEKPAAEKKA